MHAIYLGPHDEPVREDLLWWTSEHTFNRAVDAAIERGLIEPGYAEVKSEAELRRGFSRFDRYPGLPKALDAVAAESRRLTGESDDRYHHFASQMLDYRAVYRAYLAGAIAKRPRQSRNRAGRRQHSTTRRIPAETHAKFRIDRNDASHERRRPAICRR